MAKLTPKQKKFVEGVAQGKSGLQAALTAYNTDKPDVAKVIASENLTKPNIRDALIPVFEKHDINLDSAIAPIGKGLKATKWNDFTGEREDDLPTQMKASDRALKLMGVNQEGNTYNFVQVINEQKDKYAD
jgi:phage terminase small subunit